MRPDLVIGRLLDGQRGHLILWVPVCLGAGIGGYFLLPVEPGALACAAVACVACLGLILHRWCPESLAPLLTAIVLASSGFGLAVVRANLVAAPVLEFRYYGPVEGRIIELDRSQSDAKRITLDQLVLKQTSPNRTPEKVRISLHGEDPPIDLTPGLRVIVTAHLSPPPRASEPGGFDFRRLAWFERLGAVGYARTPVLALAEPERQGLDVRIYALRMALSAAVQAQLDGQTGAFAAAVTTGDRSALSRQTLDIMRDTNLAHLLAISGLHVGLLVGVVFLAVRTGLALIPALALRVNARKIGAGVALAAAAVYLGLSGAPVSTQRAFLMAAVMLCAVMIDQRALTLRAVALAAVLILLLQPDALLGAGFQMSFAATTALVWVFSGLRDERVPRLPGWARPVMALVLSSAVAGLATAPFGAAHFNRSATYGLIANLMSVPAMGSIVVPAAVAAVCLAPFGLHPLALRVMGWGIDWILTVAEWFATREAAVRHVSAPPPEVLPMMIVGGLFVILWQGRARWLGGVPMVGALVLWSVADRPSVLIAESGGLVGVMTAEGRALNKPKGDGYAALAWLEDDGDGADQALAAARSSPAFPGPAVVQLPTRAMRDLTVCPEAALIVTPLQDPPQLGCDIVTARDLSRTGALALIPTGSGIEVRSVANQSGLRFWTSPDVRRWADGRGTRPSLPEGEDVVADIARRLNDPGVRLAGGGQ
ncbi:MAG: ComEC/Rec2 family competence protein [Qingshengfaniella sp.]